MDPREELYIHSQLTAYSETLREEGGGRHKGVEAPRAARGVGRVSAALRPRLLQQCEFSLGGSGLRVALITSPTSAATVLLSVKLASRHDFGCPAPPR